MLPVIYTILKEIKKGGRFWKWGNVYKYKKHTKGFQSTKPNYPMKSIS